jgi:hypothetical protein
MVSTSIDLHSTYHLNALSHRLTDCKLHGLRLWRHGACDIVKVAGDEKLNRALLSDIVTSIIDCTQCYTSSDRRS